VSQAADRNNTLAPYETSRRKDNEEAMIGMMFHNTSRCIVNEEILIDAGRNGGDDCVVPQDNDRNNELVPYETSRRGDSEEVMVDKVFHGISRSAVNEDVLIGDRRNGDDTCAAFQEADRTIELVPYETSRTEDTNYDPLDSQNQGNVNCKSQRQKNPPITKKDGFLW
jgi:hypothetical protein